MVSFSFIFYLIGFRGKEEGWEVEGVSVREKEERC